MVNSDSNLLESQSHINKNPSRPTKSTEFIGTCLTSIVIYCHSMPAKKKLFIWSTTHLSCKYLFVQFVQYKGWLPSEKSNHLILPWKLKRCNIVFLFDGLKRNEICCPSISWFNGITAACNKLKVAWVQISWVFCFAFLSGRNTKPTIFDDAPTPLMKQPTDRLNKWTNDQPSDFTIKHNLLLDWILPVQSLLSLQY